MDDFLDLVKVGLAFFVCAVFIVVAVGILYLVFAVPACNDFSQLNPEYEFRFSFWNGCLVKAPNGRWVDVDAFPYIQGQLTIE